MNFENCLLYKLNTKKYLKYLLHISNQKLLNQNYVSSLINPYIAKNPKARLVEAPNDELKAVQKRIKKLLYSLDIPDNVFSGVKGKSYIDNAKYHCNSNIQSLFKIDLTGFFPSIKRENVFNFFFKDLKCSRDIAAILTSLTTVDLKRVDKNLDEVFSFLEGKNIKNCNHLMTGSPTSQILSYLVNLDMFNELQRLSDSYNIRMTVYVDDITFSSSYRIPTSFKQKVILIIKKYNYQISKKKVKTYTKSYPKLVTGVIIDKNCNLKIKNSTSYKIIQEFKHLKNDPEDEISRMRLRGLLTAARQINPAAFPGIYNFAFKSKLPA